MKAYLFTIFLSLSNFVICQNAFYDSQFLSTVSIKELELIEKESSSSNILLSSDELKSVRNYRAFISNPFSDTIGVLDIRLLKSSISKYNNFLYLKSLPKTGLIMNNFTSPVMAASMISAALNTGNFSYSADQQSKIIDGLTKYYANEFKKAQTITYMQIFNETLNEFGDLKILFPETYSKLKNTDPSTFPALGDEYKVIFNNDLKSLIPTLINHIQTYNADENPKFNETLKLLTSKNCQTIKSSQYFPALKIASEFSTKLINNFHPVDLFNYLDSKYYTPDNLKSNSIESEYSKLLHLFNTLQRNLLDTSKTKDSQFANIWLNYESFKNLDSFDEWKYFSGLIYQQDKAFIAPLFEISKFRDESIDSIISRTKSAFQKIHPLLIELQSFRNNILSKDEVNDEYFIDLMKITFSSINKSEAIFKNKFPKKEFDTFCQIIENVIIIYDNARKKDYSNSIYYLLKILNIYLNNQIIPNSEYDAVLNRIQKYSSFMADIVNSENSDEVKDLIQKHVAPPTSFILKRQFLSTISITGQPGYFLGIDRVQSLGQKAVFISGLTLPLGVELSFKTNKKQKETAPSLGIFVQLLDIGAVLNFRLGDTLSELPDKVTFSQIFSPGISLNYGLRNSPLTFGFGYQYTSQLRKISLQDGATIYPNGHRIFLRLAWDIPMLNLYRSKYIIRKEKK